MGIFRSTPVFLTCSAERRLGAVLAAANIGLAAAQFAEPVLFGRIIDSLTTARAQGADLLWTNIIGLVVAWVGFGLFTIFSGALVTAACRPARPPAAAYGVDVLLRARPAAPDQFSRRRPLRPPDEGDAVRTDSLWNIWVEFFPRRLCRRDVHFRAGADFAAHQLAAGADSDRGVRGVRYPDGAGVPQDRSMQRTG